LGGSVSTITGASVIPEGTVSAVVSGVSRRVQPPVRREKARIHEMTDIIANAENFFAVFVKSPPGFYFTIFYSKQQHIATAFDIMKFQFCDILPNIAPCRLTDDPAENVH
jgi:hypothetical protein